MKHIVTCFLFFLTALTCNVSAGQLSEIELVDGGIIFRGNHISQPWKLHCEVQ